MKIIDAEEFDAYWKNSALPAKGDAADSSVEKTVKEIIQAIRAEGDAALRRYTLKFDRYCPLDFEIPLARAEEAMKDLEARDPLLVEALEFSAENIRRFALKQMEQFRDFEYENAGGLFTGQRVIPVERAAAYVPGGRFPLISSSLMVLIPAFCAGVGEICLVSPPGVSEQGSNASASGEALPAKGILAAAGIAAKICWRLHDLPGARKLRIFCAGGAQAIAALALGTETFPRCDIIAGPGNKYVAMAKRILFGEAGIDLIAGPSDILVISGADPSECNSVESNSAELNSAESSSTADLIAADMLAQAEHDPDARARALVPGREAAQKLAQALEQRLRKLPTSAIAGESLESGGLVIIYQDKAEAIRIANTIAPEHLELQVPDPDEWIPGLRNYGSLFAGPLSAEVLGDYSSGLNHTLPTLGSARFTGGLSVRHFLKTPTTLRCENRAGYIKALKAAETIARAEGLAGHAESAIARLP